MLSYATVLPTKATESKMSKLLPAPTNTAPPSC